MSGDNPQTTPLLLTGYENALLKLSCQDMDGNTQAPMAALVKYADGWRQFAKHSGVDGVSTTAWTIDAKAALKNLGD